MGVLMLAVGVGISLAGCINFPSEVMLGTGGSPFIVKGTAALINNDGPCLVWLAENGVTYHLFQGTQVDNASFDQVTTPGVTSRLQIATRTDIPVACQIGTVAEVYDVLEIEE
ncbi:MAG TPA: hypothetical protein PKK06_00090 [Phycisphaerae bacterium]|nr:hypothetical protein [Phycisphaerae bacterium]HNU43990.1 hypothetical protein [Phycisphaerae bacterium]